MSSLLTLLAERGQLSVTDAAEALGVSQATVRRDFATLDRQQLATRTHGGVVASAVAYDLPVRYRTGADEAKARIAAVAAGLVTAGQSVGFNGGTTTAATARQLAARTDLANAPERPAVTVVTNALNIASELVLRPHVRTVSLGGVARPTSYEVVGSLAQMVLEQLWVDHLFLGVDAVSAANGVSCDHEGEAGINSLMVRRATEVTVVATSDKLDRHAFARICDLSAVDRIITDRGADQQAVADLTELGVSVTLA